MNNNLKSTYNKISDVFSKSQIKKAVESLQTYKDRLKLIDSIIDRRQEIIKVNDFSKIQKCAQTFSKIVKKYKNPDEDENTINQRFQMQMVISQFLKKNIQNSRSPLSSPQSIQNFVTQTLSHKKDFTQQQASSCRSRYFSSLDSLNQQNKQLEIMSDDDRDIQNLQRKIQHSLVLRTRISHDQNRNDEQNNLKVYLKQQGYLRNNRTKQSQEPQLTGFVENEQQCQSKQKLLNKIKETQEVNHKYLNQIKLNRNFQLIDDQGIKIRENKKYQKKKREIFDKSNIILCSFKI
ncbi:unnamed protein product (macronuclear) [Paramecium tetraurelia]|uniref:Uncharacterized protein n=1 Tax=Paramecium tetraurelia TaxID=5888 RepID=A0BUK3_PARTE|nr:uncharacterized protein GSPATT00005466001 [Paramecium tetraurelia]CAK62220.1 unnamed protein product [Paramecium tetraurelia]|eukprot:XP_001429618.1 hypothetical protein (macronuclear) [Paramecium tetraurelia strain d4-2]